MLKRTAVFAALCSALSFSAARAEVVCTVVADAATGKILKQEGTCDKRVTAASTFKIAISLMGYDAGFLVDEHTPALPFRDGYLERQRGRVG
ncbi:MAG TPA: penicillin-binding transpeptidase domain-containing protein [Myxococcales bacterium]|nr:penicillin-binding transpeptidase domain-containing protein [Myxococcales bacterium]